jgi:hypothetical protein
MVFAFEKYLKLFSGWIVCTVCMENLKFKAEQEEKRLNKEIKKQLKNMGFEL